MRYLYGPVQSRRLGFSLGVSLTPRKACSFDCVYCQLGRTTHKVKERGAYIDTADVLRELREYFKIYKTGIKNLDYISLSGFGEPTLNMAVAGLISGIRKLSRLPIALITNASLFSDPRARRDVLGADLIIPSLDAVTQGVFRKINRPVESIKIRDIINGLAGLRKEFSGKIYLEIMMIKDVNDSLDYARKFRVAAAKIGPDKIQLNVPVRSTAEMGIGTPSKKRLQKIKEIMGPKCELI